MTVRDCNALAWAEDYVDHSKLLLHSANRGAHNGKADVAKLWQPLVDTYYPFGAIKNRVVVVDGTPASMVLNIFARAKKVKAQVQASSGDKGKLKTEDREPKEVGVFFQCSEQENYAICSCADTDGNNVELVKPISSEGDTLSFEFSGLLKELGSELKFSICFVKPGPESGPKTAMPNNPELTVVFVKSNDNDGNDNAPNEYSDEEYDEYDSEYYYAEDYSDADYLDGDERREERNSRSDAGTDGSSIQEGEEEQEEEEEEEEGRRRLDSGGTQEEDNRISIGA